MPIITTKCYISSCEKEYAFDSLYRDKFIYCSGKCYQQAFNNTVTKNIHKNNKLVLERYYEKRKINRTD